ncbi:MAG: retropepsin-like aspartic protease [Rhizomicrobium sp.]|nr:retropepsin-like aspartic protease [Rhizomicrobium sp.]
MRIVMRVAWLGVFASAAAEPLVLPFDFSHTAIELTAKVGSTPLTMILDTGVDPSVIDLKTAAALHLAVDHGAGGEASGEGDAQSAQVYPAMQEGLALGGHVFAAFPTLATDMAGLSAQYGKHLDGVIGYSFLADKIILIDYPKQQLVLVDHPIQAWAMVRTCRLRHSVPLRSFGDDSIPRLPDFRFGSASAAISLDTGSNGGIALYQAALALPGVKEALVEKGETSFTGARGTSTAKTYALNVPVGFGPFKLPAGQVVTVRKTQGSDARAANIGNKLFAALKLKMLLDYKSRVMTFYGDCR